MDENMKDTRRVSARPRRGFIGRAATLGIALIIGAWSAAGSLARAEAAPFLVAIEVRDGVDINAIARRYGGVVTGGSKEENLYRLAFPPSRQVARLVRMRMDPRILFAEPDEILTTPEADTSVEGDPIHVPFDFSRSFSVSTFSSTFDLLTDRSVNEEAYQQINLGDVPFCTRGAGVTVAVLDTGVQTDHPSLTAHLLPGYNALQPGTAPEDIADGYTNSVVGHGTMVSGIIARLAPEAKILPIRVLNADGRGSLLSVALGIRYAMNHGANVLNLSLGTPVRSALLEDTVGEARAAGCVVIAAAGNNNTNVPQYPAACPGVLAVVALDRENRKAGFSNYGTFVTLAAPGIGIRSTYVGGLYASWSGTSFAAPFVSAAAALALAANPDWTGAWVTQRLWQTAESVNSVNPRLAGQLGKGLLNVSQALR